MRTSHLLAAGATLLATTQGLNILLTNDDGFGAASIRELYNQMTSLGHNCYIVASVASQSYTGFRNGFTTHPQLTADGDWGLVKAGAPSLGFDPSDNHIWYYNGTPAAQVVIALDYILPTVAKIATPDLVISGPNAASDTDVFLSSIYGKMGATYVALERDIPAMVFWTESDLVVPYTAINTSTQPGLQDPSTITARLASSLVEAFIKKASGDRVLPKGYGVMVDLPSITSDTSDKCTNPPFVLQSRSIRYPGAKTSYNVKTGVFSHSYAAVDNTPGADRDDKGVDSRCVSSVTIFAVKYDPTEQRECFNLTDVTAIVPVVVHRNGSMPVIGSLGPNGSISSNVSRPPPDGTTTMPPPQTIAGLGVTSQWSSSIILLGLAIWGVMY